jgi:hypothetical protein
MLLQKINKYTLIGAYLCILVFNTIFIQMIFVSFKGNSTGATGTDYITLPEHPS